MVIEKMNELVLEKYELSQEQILRDPILFGDYLNASEELGLDENGNEKPKTLRLYEDLRVHGDIKPVFDSILELYNSEHKTMNLVFFEDASNISPASTASSVSIRATLCSSAWAALVSRVCRGLLRTPPDAASSRLP